jgi:3-dehydro-L-gulonate 2-dehydrogenase
MAKESGLGLITLKITTTGCAVAATAGRQADQGCIGICTTNTIANMPPWGGKDPTLGNNPIVIAVPRNNGEHVVLDMAVSQYSYGALQEHKLKNTKLAVPGGYDEAGMLSDDPSAILNSAAGITGWLLERLGAFSCN